MKILCVLGQHNYGDPSRGEGYEFSNFIPSLRLMGHSVFLFENQNRHCYRSFTDLNRALLQTVDALRPDVVFSVQMLYEIWLETWELLRDSGISATVNWATDDSWKYRQFSRFLAPAFHAFTTTYPEVYEQYQRDGIDRVFLTQWAANAASLQPPLPAKQCEQRVSFVGTVHGNRGRIVARLRKRGIDVNCVGYGWPRGPVRSAEIPAIMRASVISLNFANSALSWRGLVPQISRQIKARTFEVPGNGGFLLTEWVNDIEQYYVPGEEIAVFRNFDCLLDQIDYFLAHPGERDEIAQAGYQRTRKDHTYVQRLSDVLEFALEQKRALEASRGQSGCIDWEQFQKAARLHSMGTRARNVRRGLVAACSAIWGPKRGPRAARRLVFEIAWRTMGARTYSAAGLPGRMFYAES